MRDRWPKVEAKFRVQRPRSLHYLRESGPLVHGRMKSCLLTLPRGQEAQEDRACYHILILLPAPYFRIY